MSVKDHHRVQEVVRVTLAENRDVQNQDQEIHPQIVVAAEARRARTTMIVIMIASRVVVLDIEEIDQDQDHLPHMMVGVREKDRAVVIVTMKTIIIVIVANRVEDRATTTIVGHHARTREAVIIVMMTTMIDAAVVVVEAVAMATMAMEEVVVDLRHVVVQVPELTQEEIVKEEVEITTRVVEEIVVTVTVTTRERRDVVVTTAIIRIPMEVVVMLVVDAPVEMLANHHVVIAGASTTHLNHPNRALWMIPKAKLISQDQEDQKGKVGRCAAKIAVKGEPIAMMRMIAG